MLPPNEMSKDVKLFLEEEGFSGSSRYRLFEKKIFTYSTKISIQVFFYAERSPFESIYCIRCYDLLATDKGKILLLSFNIDNGFFNFCVFKKILSNIDLVCEDSIKSGITCLYEVESNKDYFCRFCNKLLAEEFYK